MTTVSSTASPTTGSATGDDTVDTPVDPRITYQPALDGLRGLAVAGVIAFHLGHLRGGFLGVDLFFTLSGYLITRLLLQERATRGAVDLKQFWTRRARRLLPALYLLLAFAAAYAAWFARPDELPGIRGPGLSALAYVANWWAIISGDGYWDLFATPSPLEHLWSLSIEEQFYVIWPLAVVALLGPAIATRRLLIVTVIAALVSTGLMAVLVGDDPSDAYLNTFTRAGSMLVGAAAAVLIHRRRGEPLARGANRALQAIAIASIALLAWMWIVVDGTELTIYRGGFLLHALATAAIIAAITVDDRSPVARGLRFEPLRQLGLVSYGAYLWHWPVIVVVNSDRTGLDGAPLLILRLTITAALTIASYVLVEQPIRHSRAAPRLVGLYSFGVALLLAVGLFITTVPPDARVTVASPAPTLAPATTATAADDEATNGTAGEESREFVATPPGGAPVEPADGAAGRPADETEAATEADAGRDTATEDASDDAGSDDAGGTGASGILSTEPEVETTVRTPTADDPLRVMLTGDSFMFDAEPGIAAALSATDAIDVAEEARFGFRITDDGWEDVLEEQVALADPEVVVAMWAVFDSAWLTENDPDEYRERLDRAIEILTADGAVVAFVGLAPSLSGGVDPAPIDREINELFRELPERHPGSVYYVDPDPIVAPDGTFERELETSIGTLLVRKTDGNHYCPDGSARFGLAIGELLDQLTGLAQVDPGLWWAGDWRADERYDEPVGACL